MQLDFAYTWTSILQQIEQATDVSDLRSIHLQMNTAAHRWRERGMPVPEIMATVNTWHDLLIRRVIDLTLSEMEQSGFGGPPSPFCWLLLGSGGRQEQTLHLDQDNALLYQGGLPEQQATEKAYFQKMAERVVTHLDDIGYPYCQGYVMATNTRWNLSFAEWQAMMSSYLALPNWDHVRFLMIACDMRPIYGETQLAHDLFAWLRTSVQEQPFLHWQVADHVAEHEVGVDGFQRFRVERFGEHQDEVNIKERGYLQIVNSVRIWALANGIEATSTAERIVRLQERDVWKADVAQEVQEAFAVLLQHRLWCNYVCPQRLSDAERSALKTAMQTIKRLQKRTAKQFRKPR